MKNIFGSTKKIIISLYRYFFLIGIISSFTKNTSSIDNATSNNFNKRPWCDYVVSDKIISNVLKGETVRMDNGLLIDNETVCDKDFQYVISIKHGYMNGKVWKYSGNVLQSITEYSKTKKHGKEIMFYKNGNVYKEYIYQNNKLNGITSEYRDNGSLFMQTTYLDNKRNGESFVYDKNGNLLYKTLFNNDKLSQVQCMNGYNATKKDYKLIRACEKKSVNSVFYDYIFTYPALCIPE